jgi:uncharacterized protein (TIGR02466 family)
MTPLFKADLFVKKQVGTLGQRESLLKNLYELKKHNPASPNSNKNCWRMFQPPVDIDWIAEEVSNLALEAIDFYTKEDNIYAKSSEGKNFLELTHWVNINAQGSRNVMHDHKGGEFSAVYYLQGENCGPLRLVNPANILGDHVNGVFVRDFYFHPKDGDLILFPSWVPHEVEPNFSPRDRVNIAFDIRYITKEQN